MRAKVAFMVSMALAAACSRTPETRNAARAADSSRAPVDWVVTGHRIPGVSAMSDSLSRRDRVEQVSLKTRSRVRHYQTQVIAGDPTEQT